MEVGYFGGEEGGERLGEGFEGFVVDFLGGVVVVVDVEMGEGGVFVDC